MPIQATARQPRRAYIRRGHPLTKGLVAAWPFMEGAGQTVHDVSGNQLHGTLTDDFDDMWDVSPVMGRRLDNESTGQTGADGVDVANAPAWSTSTTLSVSYWTKDPLSDDFNTNFLRAGGDEFVCDIQNDGAPMIFTTGGNTNGNGSIAIDDGSVHHVATTWNQVADTVKIWVDGIISTDVSSYGDTSSASEGANLSLMYDGSSGNEIVGKLSNVLYWYDRELTEADARLLASNPYAPYITKPR